ncbi:lysine N(6)-hydroxylase/L-ornithine N(5)-oxygenase family protein [Fictibacillus phosphorivorans]|uniref:lysine N(6)-hydroxylase/L-ornithine N(5)-oxygenase family protein n=1 Tax=Fictibacillus phosphorivorans TaxID=1221500 RepID=UPI00203BE51E|nr:lysine N(6)-hydroxylase/L-ornithine N(5)-oxygenase family protein [Fictibacillus phosphorivorans]MCM3720023.1 lysine N(6)-hydroxylase/L-ornithine N(5)-oxygenase family protein [Fictibacillus phosphorivorans]MCM3777707.1 lysine N(6)-hydroxylase/L-ornithine N(5)-oxygenase family protein [Fictibacillus phosphorivorans]
MSLEKPQQVKVYDLIGVGIGPFNLGLAAMLDETEGKDALFFEKKTEFNWHKGMLIDGTTLQVPFFADLVSMANVKSKYTFLNYLQEHNRLYHFYFLENFHIPRKEYNHYCQWALSQLDTCHFGMAVEQIMPVEDGVEPLYEVIVRSEESGETSSYYTRHLSVGIGTSPAVPSHLEKKLGAKVIHSSQYLDRKEELLNAKSITVIGSGQSAAEVFYDLAQLQSNDAYTLNWFTRSKGFFPMEYSKLGLEYFSPDYTNFFYQLPSSKKDELLKKQDLLYKGISMDTIADIYDLLYEKSVGQHKPEIHLQAMTELVSLDHEGDTPLLSLRQNVTGEVFELESDVVILGTGYAPSFPHFLMKMQERIEWDSKNRYQITHDYRLKTKDMENNHIFIQNGELHTHGVGAPDLGLGAHRNAVIINKIFGEDIYPVHEKNVFQNFRTDPAWKPVAAR